MTMLFELVEQSNAFYGHEWATKQGIEFAAWPIVPFHQNSRPDMRTGCR